MQSFWDNTKALSQTAIRTPDGGEITYAELYDAADAFASQLLPRSLVLILTSNSKDCLIAYIACLRHNHVALLISKETKPHMVSTLCEIYVPDYTYAPGKNGGYLLQQNDVTNKERAELHPELALLLSTSGSTGSPKLVRLTKDNLLANAASITSYLQLNSDERAITNLPFYYSYGLSVINSHLQIGATLLLTDDSIISPSFWKFFDTNQATSLAGVPYTYEMLEMFGFRKRKVDHLRYITQAGGHMAASLVEKYAQWAHESNIRFYVMYGQTEATARMSYLPPELALQHSDSIGIAIPGGCFSLVDSEGNTIEQPYEVGELVYHGKNVCMGYAETRDDLSKGNTNKGVLRTGDMAKFDENRLYYITGRRKRFLKIAGNRFGLDELEAEFQKIGITAVCGGSDNKLMVAVTQPNDTVKASEFLKSTWHLLKNQYKIIQIEKIPRSESGKVLYSKIFSEIK